MRPLSLICNFPPLYLTARLFLFVFAVPFVSLLSFSETSGFSLTRLHLLKMSDIRPRTSLFLFPTTCLPPLLPPQPPRPLPVQSHVPLHHSSTSLLAPLSRPTATPSKKPWTKPMPTPTLVRCPIVIGIAYANSSALGSLSSRSSKTAVVSAWPSQSLLPVVSHATTAPPVPPGQKTITLNQIGANPTVARVAASAQSTFSQSRSTIGRSIIPGESIRIAIARALLANSWLVTDYSPFFPYAACICDYLFLSDECPHNLIIVLPSCTLRVYLLPYAFLTRYTLRVPRELRCYERTTRIVRHLFLRSDAA